MSATKRNRDNVVTCVLLGMKLRRILRPSIRTSTIVFPFASFRRVRTFDRRWTFITISDLFVKVIFQISTYMHVVRASQKIYRTSYVFRIVVMPYRCPFHCRTTVYAWGIVLLRVVQHAGSCHGDSTSHCNARYYNISRP